MRKSIHQQLPLTPAPISHQHSEELQRISEALDAIPKVLDLVYADLTQGVNNPQTGRPALTAEQVLRALIAKQMNGWSYAELEFHLMDSSTYRIFCRLGMSQRVTASRLQRDIKKVRAETLEKVNRLIVDHARDEGVESGKKVRVDCTVTETNIHYPNDSSLLWDSVRVLVRLMLAARVLLGRLPFTDHRKRAKRRALGISHATRKAERTRLYRDLIKVTEQTVRYAGWAVEELQGYVGGSPVEMAMAYQLGKDLEHFIGLSLQVLDQTRRRVLKGESVPAKEKLVSIFEPHTDIIRKDRRDTYFGHKICLTAGEALITDCVIERGNYADSNIAVKMVERHPEIFGRLPRQVAFDGGFASKDNLSKIKAMGVKDVCFAKRCGLKIVDMVKSTWVYRKLRSFRSGIEGMISFLKRAFGLDRCTWRGYPSFKSYVWSSIISANLLLIARHQLK